MSIFLLLNLFDDEHDFEYQFETVLVEILTGEGKSITLAILATIICFLGYNVV